jgi:Leucine-rich repeat (LRR) protein
MTNSLIIETLLLAISYTSSIPDKTVGQTSFNKKLNSDTTTVVRSFTEKLKSNHIPDSIFNLINLKYLSIQGMDCDYRVLDDKGSDITKCWMIIEIPSQIKKLKKLESLHLNVNAISEIPIELSELKNLKSLDLTDNSGLSNIDNVVKLEKLETLSLNGCGISKLPDNIGQLKKLKSLGLAGNNISSKEKERIKKALPNCEIYY